VTLITVSVSKSEDIAPLIDKATTEGTNLLLLYDNRVDELLHGHLNGLAMSDENFSIIFPGDKIRTEKEYYEAVRDSVPLAGYMSFGWDPLIDILSVEAVSCEPEKPTYWIWENSHVFFQSDHESFRRFYHIMTLVARKVRSGYADAQGNVVAPKPGWIPQRLVLILTGRSDVMASDASQSRSSLYHLPYDAEYYFPDLSTQTVAYHLK
jgi:hypothetical protein